MKAVAHAAAFLLFLVIYFVSALVGGLVVIKLPGFLVKFHGAVGVQGPRWWLVNGVPFIISIIAGTIGAYAASAAVRYIFRSIPLIRVALAFVVFVTFQWLGEMFFGNLSWFAYANGVAMAAAASIAALEEGGRLS